MEIDPLQEIRAIRERISRECGDDPDKVFDYYQRRQEELMVGGNYTIVNKPLTSAISTSNSQ